MRPTFILAGLVTSSMAQTITSLFLPDFDADQTLLASVITSVRDPFCRLSVRVRLTLS
jgi:hypothetical protein